MKRRSSPASKQTDTSKPPQVQEPPRRRRKALSKGTEQPSIKKPATTLTAAKAHAADNDGLQRCDWVGMYKGAAAAEYVRYHDEEWGRPEHDDHKLFELLILEGAQAGLSWSTILAKRQAYRTAFEGFDPQMVAAFDDSKVQQMLAPESGVVKHKGKLQGAVTNAKVFLQLQQEHGSFDAFVWSFVPQGKPIVNNWTHLSQMPTKTPESEALSKALKTAGMTFVGPTIMYAFMQAVGMVDDHLVSCHCRSGAN